LSSCFFTYKKTLTPFAAEIRAYEPGRNNKLLCKWAGLRALDKKEWLKKQLRKLTPKRR
jgi:hypothetical protein